jgi:hypothetical protein
MTTKLSSVASFLFVMFRSIQALLGQISSLGLPSLRGRPLSPLVSGPTVTGSNRPLPKEQLPFDAFQHGSERSRNRRARFSTAAGRVSGQLPPNPYSAAPLPAANGLVATQVGPGGAATYPVVSGCCNGEKPLDVAMCIHNIQSPAGTYLVILQKSPPLCWCACAETTTAGLSLPCIQNITWVSHLASRSRLTDCLSLISSKPLKNSSKLEGRYHQL